MERHAQKTPFQKARPDGQYSARFNLSTEPATPLPTAMLLCDSTIQNRLMGKYLADYGICRTYLASPSQLNALMQCERPALILLDIRSSDRAVADLLSDGATEADSRRPTTPMILLNVPSNADIKNFMGRRDIVAAFHDNESVDQLLAKIRSVVQPETSRSRAGIANHLETLTRKEMAVLRALALGLSNDHIADQLSVSPHTVKTHLYNAYRKIGCTNRVAAAMWAQRALPLIDNR